MIDTLYSQESPAAARQPKTDRLILARLLDEEANDARLDEAVAAAQEVLTRWADLETSGRLDGLTETQLQGDFLAEVFGKALGYVRAAEGAAVWNLEQHAAIGGQTPDAILGRFRQGQAREPEVVVELKGPRVHLDRDRSNGRTAVDQCWDYLVNTPRTCRWGIVSNIISFRLYERDSTKRAYEHFTLQSLRDTDVCRRFVAIFHRDGLVRSATLTRKPRAVSLLERSVSRQREVGDALYATYSDVRARLIDVLHREREHPIELAIEMTQRLLDRIMFIAFCEDRGLLPEQTIHRAYSVQGFSAVTNPRWHSFKSLFRFVDEGAEPHGIPEYNGGLFAPHAVDDIDLPDEPWTTFFNTVGGYDFADEVNLDVLGHLFERSITELEKLKHGGLFTGSADDVRRFATMPQSEKRRRLGVYYTPEALTSRIVRYTVEELIDRRFVELSISRGVAREDAERGALPDGELEIEHWRACLDVLRRLKVVDPACGSGAFLFQAYNTLELRYHEVIGNLERLGAPDAAELAADVPRFILNENIYGVDLSPEAVEITQLALWIRSAVRGQTLASLSANIVHGNSLVDDPKVDPAAFDWRERFPAVFDRPEGGFDCVIGNPPWERIKVQEREFFSLSAPEIATATNAATRKKLVRELERSNPALHALRLDAGAAADALLDHCRKSGRYPLTGRGDINLYAVFAELAMRIVAPEGRVGLLTPSGIASDKTTKDFFAEIAEHDRLIRLYDFENKKTFFPEVHASFKFCILNFHGAGGASVGAAAARRPPADFAFFLHHAEELDDPARHIPLSGADIRLLNPNTRTCPIFRTRRDAEITKAIYRRVPVLVDRNREGPTGNPWGVRFWTMFHQTNDAGLFVEPAALTKRGFRPAGNRWVKGKKVYLPVYEAKMVQVYDHRAADVRIDADNWVRQGQTNSLTLVDHQNPERLAMPRCWVEEAKVECVTHHLCFKDVTSPTNQRTMIAAMIPRSGVFNSAPLIEMAASIAAQCCLLANLNSIAYDYVARQKVSNVHLNFFIVEQLPVLPPDVYERVCPWSAGESLGAWVGERVLKLTCTAEDMLPLAEACDFTGGSFKKEYGGRLNKWDPGERAELIAELDAAYFHLYGVGREDAAYVLSTFKGIDAPDPLLPGSVSPAARVLGLYDLFAARMSGDA